jgi:hypothetical protein
MFICIDCIRYALRCTDNHTANANYSNGRTVYVSLGRSFQLCQNFGCGCLKIQRLRGKSSYCEKQKTSEETHNQRNKQKFTTQINTQLKKQLSSQAL